MSDLSRLLGDVYGTGSEHELQPKQAAVATPVAEPETSPLPAAPDWADDSVLDAAFADWVPGPPSDAPAAERAALADLAAFEPAPQAEPVAEPDVAEVVGAPASLAEALPVEAAWFFDVPADQPVIAAEPLEAVVDLADEPATSTPWQRADDDLLPAKGRRRFRR